MTSLTINRLNKQEIKILRSPPPNAIVRRKGVLNFHFVIYGLDGDYTGGYYHGVLELASDYPFAPPKLKFFTPSGRFQTDAPICTTFTNFHKESWSTIWNVETMVVATVSFLQSNQNTNGAVKSTSSEKRKLAKESLDFNLNNPVFVELFGDCPEIAGQLKQKNQQILKGSQDRTNSTSSQGHNSNRGNPSNHNPGDAGSAWLMIGLGVVLVGYVYVRIFL